jgi:arginine decarboxylase
MSTPARKRPLAAVGRPRAREQYEESAALYGIANWGKGYFQVNEDGDLVVHPTREAGLGIVLKQVVDEVALRGITAPMIVRFPQILASAVA